ncbi:MAG TPA: hypothetical protein VF131_01920 [Blastocatellia bacterium]|nr:hypothetical protein [Blastocatellia bacterium]
MIYPRVTMSFKTRLFTGQGLCYADNTDPRTASRFKLCQGSVFFVAGVGKCDRCGIINRLVEPGAEQPDDSPGNVLTFLRADPPKQARLVRV